MKGPYRRHNAMRNKSIGAITARAHLLARSVQSGPRLLVQKLQSREDRCVRKLLSFVVAYADRGIEDFNELK